MALDGVMYRGEIEVAKGKMVMSFSRYLCQETVCIGGKVGMRMKVGVVHFLVDSAAREGKLWGEDRGRSCLFCSWFIAREGTLRVVKG